MPMRRRDFLVLSGAAVVQACSGSTAGGAATRPALNAGWQAWVDAFRPRARANGISQATLATGFQGAGYLPDVVALDRNQSEFKRSFEDYLALVATEERVQRGRAAYATHRASLNAIEARYGVPAEIVAAIWGVESNFGGRRGDIPVISATSTLAYDGRRGRFFESQLIAALRILQSGDVSAAGLVGSWAGAMGHTQFIPTSYQQFAVDFDGDGRRDIWADDPTDALASAAAYLARSGWQRGALWSREAATGGIQPDAGGPRFATGPNFEVIKRYNRSTNYALGVGYLARRLAGEGSLNASFAPDENGLTQNDRREIQSRLMARGYDTGGADGVFGPKTRAAIAAFQKSIGQAATGVPSPALLGALR
ncbi:MAG: lytic murein transglycosylase [Pseudomonadota bacterium]